MVFEKKYSFDIFGLRNSKDAPPKSEISVRVKSVLAKVNMTGEYNKDFSEDNLLETFKNMLAKEDDKVRP